ncbi:hypothetical protein Tco_0403333 [Tanacetum coccineum]
MSYLNECPKLLSKDNRWDKRSFKDKIPPSIHENPLYQCLGRHPVNVRTFPDPILFLAGLKPSWEHGQQRPAMVFGGKEMDFRNFMFAEDDEDMSFLLREPSPGFGTSSPSASINNEPPSLEIEPLDSANPEQLVKNTADSGGSLVREEMPIIVQTGSSSRSTRQKTSPAKVESSAFLTISNDEEGLPDVPELQNLDAELLDLHDRCYARQAVVDNAINRRAQELLKVVEQMKGECEVLKEREKAMNKECEELKAKCEATMEEFDKNHVVMVLCQKIMSLLAEVKEHKESMERMMLEARNGLDTKRTLRPWSRRAEVVSKVVPYVDIDLVQSDEIAMLVGKLVSFAIFYGRCTAFEEVADMKEPFDMAKVKGYMPSYKKEHTKGGNDLSTATFPFLSEVVVDPSASVEVLLSKKPKSLCRPTPTKTHAPVPSAPS